MIRLLSVASEIYPLIKTGGLADVVGALPSALAAYEVAATTLVPGYPAVLAALRNADVLLEETLFGGPARLLHGQASGLDIMALDAPHLFARPGNPYTQPDGADWPDNAHRFAALSQIAAKLGAGGLPGFAPDIVHAHDWQAALTMAYLKYAPGRRPGTVMTVHNLAFQGLFPAEIFASLGLPPQAFAMDGVEFHGQVGFLKAGLALADKITTVSPSYAEEIKTPENGMGLEGLLQFRANNLHGILNGIDDAVWNPATDPHIATTYNPKTPARRALNKQAVQTRFGLAPKPKTLLLGVISRLTWQKGLDLLLDCVGDLANQGAQLALLGTGESSLESGFTAAASAHLGCVIGYDESLAHLMQSGIDALLVPSRFEPCGLTQLCALRYGAIPVVARVGGLADTIIDANEAALASGVATGLQHPPGQLRAVLPRLQGLWRDQRTWRKMQLNGMKSDVSWRGPAEKYAKLYKGIVEG